MRRCGMTKLWVTICLIFVMIMAPGNGLEAQAVEILATVQGTVLSGTNAGLLKLSTKEGYMEIKIDSGTDTSACKVLLPDSRVSVSVGKSGRSCRPQQQPYHHRGGAHYTVAI